MTVQIATDDHEDLKRIVQVLEAGVAPWPAYAWKPRWPQPWILLVDEHVAQEVVRKLYGDATGAGLAQVVAVQAGLGADVHQDPVVESAPAPKVSAAPPVAVAPAAAVPAPAKKAVSGSKKSR